MQVMRESEQRRPRLRRLGDQLGAVYTPVAVALAGVAWLASGDATRFLAVLVVATPCPLLIAIPVAIIGSVSLAARRGIIIKDPSVLEKIDTCRTAIFDKTGTLTYGAPQLTEILPAPGFTEPERARERRRAWSGTRATRWPRRSWKRHGGTASRSRKRTEVSEQPGRGAARRDRRQNGCGHRAGSRLPRSARSRSTRFRRRPPAWSASS